MPGINDITTVAIIGGGFSGAAVALHLAQNLTADRKHQAVRIVIFEPRAQIGAGLAYDTHEPTHRINVPGERMSLFPDEPEHFHRWLETTTLLQDDPEAFVDGVSFPRREAFGLYVASNLAPLLTSGAIEHWQSRAVKADKTRDGWRIESEDGRKLTAEALVLAVSHPAPSLPTPLLPVRTHPGLVADATTLTALDNIAPNDHILLVGNGLTAADVIATLKSRGHKGQILSISRRGLRSRGHPDHAQEPFGDFIAKPPKRASELLQRVRQTLRAAQAQELSWHPVLDAVRLQGQDIWSALPVSERRRLARHVRPFWDVHRFRIAPQVEAALDQAILDGSLSIRAASIQGAEAQGDRLRIRLKERHTSKLKTLDVDRIVVTTGPAHGGILKSQPLLSHLAQNGDLALCPTGLGLLCDREARAISSSGHAEDTLLIAGPLARGTFGELMGLPQVAEHAVFVAGKLRHLVESHRQSHAEQALV